MSSKKNAKVSVSEFVFDANPRSAACLALEKMVDSITQKGWLGQHVPEVEKTGENTYLVLTGNRRCLGLQHVAHHTPELFARILPTGKIGCIVYEGLTERERVEIRIDHNPAEDRVPLDAWSEYQAIKQLLQVGYATQDEVASKLGLVYSRGKNIGKPNRSYAQVRINLARLPQCVEAEARKLCTDPKSTKLQWSKIAGLYKVFSEEFADYPDGDGPLFKAAWQKANAKPETNEDGTKKRAVALTPGAATKRAEVASSSIVKRILLAATGQGEETLGSLDERCVVMERAARTLQMIADDMGTTEFDAHCADLFAKQVETEVVAN